MNNNYMSGVNGVRTYTDMPKTAKYFQDVTIIDTVIIPDYYPAIDSISSIVVYPKILYTKLINTPMSVSYEGQHLSGYKLIIELNLQEKIKYVAEDTEQSVHAINYTSTHKSIFIVVPKEINGNSISDLIRRKKFSAMPYVQDVFAIKKSPRSIYKAVSILVNVKFF